MTTGLLGWQRMTPPQMLRSNDPTLSDRLRRLAARSVPPDLADNRFDESWEHDIDQAGERFVAAVMSRDDGEFTAYVGGIAQGAQLHLDALIDLELSDPLATMIQLLRFLAPSVGLLDANQQSKLEASNQEVIVWTKPSSDWQDGLTDLELGSGSRMETHRALHQMQAPMADVLSNDKPLATRAFIPGIDDEALRLLNNRAFAKHPDQGGQSKSRFKAGLDQDWVCPEGIRIYEVDNKMAGFCWTRIHQEPPLGEIYVIGIDPDFHGQGLGGPMTAAGLHWLQNQGLDTAMLYVEANNEPALATYERLGFRTVRTDRSWRWLTLR